jgi:hypothetical protein
MPSAGPQAASGVSASPHASVAPIVTIPRAEPPPARAESPKRFTTADEAWRAAAGAQGGRQFAQIAAVLVRADTSRQLHALALVLRDELDDDRKRVLRKQLEYARKRHWLYEHRLAIALAALDASNEALAHQVLIDDGIPLDSVNDTAAELRQNLAARRNGQPQ